MTKEQIAEFEREAELLEKEHRDLMNLPDNEFLSKETTRKREDVNRRILELCKRVMRA